MIAEIACAVALLVCLTALFMGAGHGEKPNELKPPFGRIRITSFHKVNNITMENWKPVPEYEGVYEVSGTGRVISFNTKARFLTLTKMKNGYSTVTLTKERKNRVYLIHRLVAQVFHENPEHKETVNHIDGNKDNNSAANLEWATRSENMIHAFRNGLISKKRTRQKAA